LKSISNEMRQFIFHKNKRVYVTISFLMAFTIHLCSQTLSTKDLAQFLFPDFSGSIVKMKAATDISLVLNYNTVSEKMVFQQDGQLYDVVNPEAIDTIYLHNSSFVYYDTVFYEVVVKGIYPFYIQHKSYISYRNKPASSGTSQVSASNYYPLDNASNVNLNLKLPSNYIVKSSPVYWVTVNDIRYSFINEKQFLKIFPEKATRIKEFIKGSGIKIKNREDLIKLGNFCNELIK
jgi:hypothetical protein